MKYRILSAAALIFCLAAGPTVAAEELTKQKTADIEKLIEMTGAVNIGKQMSEFFGAQLWQTIKAARPDIPPTLFDVLQQEVNGVIDRRLPELTDLIVPVYHRNFSHAEIKELIAFYNGRLGQKLIAVMPGLVQESMNVGQQWGQSIAPEIQIRVLERFKSEGVEFPA